MAPGLSALRPIPTKRTRTLTEVAPSHWHGATQWAGPSPPCLLRARKREIGQAVAHSPVRRGSRAAGVLLLAVWNGLVEGGGGWRGKPPPQQKRRTEVHPSHWSTEKTHPRTKGVEGYLC